MNKAFTFKVTLFYSFVIFTSINQTHSISGKCYQGNEFSFIMNQGEVALHKKIQKLCFGISKENFKSFFKDLKNSTIAGEGAFGIVYEYQNKSSKLFESNFYKDEKAIGVKVMKDISYSELFVELNSSVCLGEFQEFQTSPVSELAIIHYCFYDVSVKPRQYHLTMKFYPHSLEDLINGEITVSNYGLHIKKIMWALCIQLEKLHLKNFLHRDIKPKNILLDDKFLPHFADFGVSSTDLVKAQSVVGSLPYMAPAIGKKEHYGRHGDLFALGLVFNNLVQKNIESHHQMLRKANAKEHYKSDDFSNYNVDLNNLEWPQEYQFLSNLLVKKSQQDKVLKDVILNLKELIKADLGILEENKHIQKHQNSNKEFQTLSVQSQIKLNTKFTRQSRTRVYRQSAILQSRSRLVL